MPRVRQPRPVSPRPCARCGVTFLPTPEQGSRARRCPPCVPRCAICGDVVDRGQKRCRGCARIHVIPGARIDSFTRYDDDAECQRFVADHPDGAPLEEIGEAMGLTRERIRQIEEVALRRFASRLRFAGITEDDVAAMLSVRSRIESAWRAT